LEIEKSHETKTENEPKENLYQKKKEKEKKRCGELPS
jgi:hypothetical protein